MNMIDASCRATEVRDVETTDDCKDAIIVDGNGHRYMICKRRADVATPATWCIGFELPDGWASLEDVYRELDQRCLSKHINDLGCLLDPVASWSGNDVYEIAKASGVDEL